MQKLINFNKIV